MSRQTLLICLLLLVKICAFFAVHAAYDFHRDELLYLALGKHPDWGHWSNPPMIGWLAALIRMFPQPDPDMVRLLPLLASSGTLLLALRIAVLMGGGFFAQFMTGLALLICPPYLRTMVMFQPVVFDLFFWTLCAYFLVWYLKTGKQSWLIWLGVSAGFGLLNKYLLLVFALSLLIALLIGSHRDLFKQKGPYLALGAALLVWSPNLIWQAAHGFPVFHHLQQLGTEQLVHISAEGFLSGQLLAHLPAFFLIPLGLLFYVSESGRSWRVMGWVFLFTELILLICKGKDYYAFGLYPFVLASGAVFLEKLTAGAFTGKAIRVLFAAFCVGVGAVIFPLSIPCLAPEKMAAYCIDFQRITGISGPIKWEDGADHELPQDFADMQGWREIATAAIQAWQQSADKTSTLLYAENYGQAAAIDWYGQSKGVDEVYSFSDTYLLWLPNTLDREIQTFIYVNDTLGRDVEQMFASVEQIGRLNNPLAREYGTTVFVCRQPRNSFRDFYRLRVKEVKDQFRSNQ